MIQRADPRARRKAVVAVAGIAVGGAVLIGVGGPSLQRATSDALAGADRATTLRVLLLFVAALILPLLGFAAYLWRLGGRVISARRFPLPGAAVIRDTLVLEADDARRRGRVFQGLAAALAIAALALVFFASRL